MNVYQCIEHFDEEFGLRPMLDFLFGEQGAEGGFPLPSARDGSKQALLYDEYGLWVIGQGHQRTGAEDHVRHFPFTIVTSCVLRQTREARRAMEDTDSAQETRLERVLRDTVLEVSISDSFFHFDGRLIADVVSDPAYYPEIVESFFGIVRGCAQYGVPVEAASSMAPVLAGASHR